MDNGGLKRADVDNLASKILVNFGIINAAALAATFSDIAAFQNQAHIYAIGLICSVASQLLWYFHAVLEYSMEINTQNSKSSYTLAILVIVFGCISGGSIIHGCVLIIFN